MTWWERRRAMKNCICACHNPTDPSRKPAAHEGGYENCPCVKGVASPAAPLSELEANRILAARLKFIHKWYVDNGYGEPSDNLVKAHMALIAALPAELRISLDGVASPAASTTPTFPDCNVGTPHECCVARMKRLEKEQYGLTWATQGDAPDLKLLELLNELYVWMAKQPCSCVGDELKGQTCIFSKRLRAAILTLESGGATQEDAPAQRREGR